MKNKKEHKKMKEIFVKGQRFLVSTGPSNKTVTRNRIKARRKVAKEIIRILMGSPLYWCCSVNQRVEIVMKHLGEIQL